MPESTQRMKDGRVCRSDERNPEKEERADNGHGRKPRLTSHLVDEQDGPYATHDASDNCIMPYVSDWRSGSLKTWLKMTGIQTPSPMLTKPTQKMGGEIPVAHSYINEWSTSRRRGRYFLLYSVIFGFGALICAVLGVWIIPTFGWQYMFVIGALPALIAIYLRWSVPESPRWLVAKGQFDEADRIVARAEKSISKGGKVLLPPVVAINVQGADRKMHLAELFRGFTFAGRSCCGCLQLSDTRSDRA
jgi:hypothetical protein